MKERTIARVVRIARLGEIDERAEKLAYWSKQTVEAKIFEVESLRRLWIETTGDPDLPIQRVVNKRPLSEPRELDERLREDDEHPDAAIAWSEARDRLRRRP